jgi:polygalacturonase
MKTTSSFPAGRVQHRFAAARNHFYRRISPAALFIVALGALSMGSARAATYNVKNSPYNATGNGTTDDTTAVTSAITAANSAGGGVVEFPSGTYLCGSIKILSNVTLQLDTGSTIKGHSGKINAPESENSSYASYQDYGHDYFHDALIWADGASNIGITGPGTIDGNSALQTSQPSSGSGIGTKGVSLKQCNGVVLSGFTIKNGGWFGLFTQGTNNVVMTSVNIKDSNQRDAFDLVNGQHYDISDCDIEGSDDSMCLKSDYALGPKDASGNTWDNQDIHVDGCTILSTGNNAVQIGSETVFNFHDCTFSNLTITQAGKSGLGVTSNDGAVIDGITFSDITMTNCVAPIHLRLLCMGRAPGSPGVGKIKNISFINITSSGQPTGAENSNPCTVFGYTTATIDNIVFNNVKTTAPGGDTTATDSKNNYPEDIVGNPSPSTGYGWQPRYVTTLVSGSSTTTGEPPAYGFFLRHVNGVSFINCQTHFSSNDYRAAVVCDNDGKNIKVDGLTAQVSSSAPYDLSFVATNGYQSTNNLNTTGGALRINTTSYSSNSPLPVNSSTSTSASITSPAVFTPYSGTYMSGQTVTLASATSGASIRYTTDDSVPSETAGTLYSGPITLTADTTIKAIAYVSGSNDSAVNTALYTIASSGGSAAAAPSFSPAGGTYTTAQTVTITSSTSGASIRYTTDGSTPSETAGTLYSSPVSISATCTLNAIAYASGFTDSSVTSATYTINSGGGGTTYNFEAESLTYTPNGATAALQTDVNSSNGQWVVLSATAAGQYIDYAIPSVTAGTYQVQMEYKGNNSRGTLQLSVDGANLGSTVDEYSSAQVYPTVTFGNVTFSSTGTHTIRLTVTGKNSASSGYGLSADKFVLTGQSGGNPPAAAPSFSPAGGTFTSAQTVTITSSTSGASIRYTTDGSTPSETAGTVYSSPVSISATATLKAIAYASGYTDSSVTSATYTISVPTAAAPGFSPAGGTYSTAQSVTITSTTSGATIRYTTDGSTPSETAGTVYSSPVSISATGTLKAIAYASGYTDSSVTSASYTIGSTPQTLSFEAESITYTPNGATASVQTDANASGGKWIQLSSTAAGQYIEYTLPNVPAGTYSVQMSSKTNNNRGILQLSVDGTNLGSTLDQYVYPSVYPNTTFGTVTFSSTGNHVVRLTVTGKNASSSGYGLSADKFTLVGQ